MSENLPGRALDASGRLNAIHRINKQGQSKNAVSVSQKVVHGGKGAAVGPVPSVPKEGERFTAKELASRFGVREQGDMRVNHAGKCIVIVDQARGNFNGAGGGGTALIRIGRDAGRQGSRGGRLIGDNLLLSRSREEGYTVLYFVKVKKLLEFSARVVYDSHAFKNKGGGDTRRVVIFKLRTIDNKASGSAPDAPPSQEGRRGEPDPDMIARVERIIYLHHPYEGKDRLLRVLPSRVSSDDLDRILDHLKSSKKISLDGKTIRWGSKPAIPGSTGAGKCEGSDKKAGCAPILAGTRFETIEEGKHPTETTGEYIARIVNEDEPGSCTAEDAKEIDEDMRRLAKGEYYSHEQVWKEFGL